MLLGASAGGNDALHHSSLLDRGASSSGQVLGWVVDAVEGFERRYRETLRGVLARALPVTLCTIHNGSLGPPTQRLATEHRVPVIELRRVCTEPADYANPIEPSVRGGGKIARAIAGAVLGGG